MKRALLLVGLFAFAACNGGRGPILRGPSQVQTALPPPPLPPPAIPADANFILSLTEAVASIEADIPSYAGVTVDSKDLGRTETAPKSQTKRWGAELSPGNHLFKFQVFSSTAPDSWTPLADSWQPPERFIRVEPGQRTTATLKLSEGGRRHTLQVTREPLK